MQLKKLVKRLSKDLTILIVEDDIIITEVYKKMFAQYFAHYYIAQDGQEAFDIYMDNPNKLDLILCDINMPKVNGIELLKKIRALSLEQSVIIATSVQDPLMIQELSLENVSGMLFKPIQENMLFTLLFRVLSNIQDKKDLEIYLNQLEDLSNENAQMKIKLKKLITKISTSSGYDKEKTIHDLKILLDDPESLSSLQKEAKNTQKVTKVITQPTQDSKDLRASILDKKISASEFIATQDDTIIDKIEIIYEHMEELSSYIYELSLQGNALNLENIKHIAFYLQEFLTVLESFATFHVAVRAFSNLIYFFNTLEEHNLQDKEINVLFLEFMTHFIHDIEMWIKTIFIEQNSDNIYYGDASFVSNCLNISALLSAEQENDDDDDDDNLDFF